MASKLNVRKTLYLFTASIFTLTNFVAFLISRNNAWVNNPGKIWMFASSTEYRDYPASEFERTLSCYGIGQCQRIGGALIVQPLIFFGDLLSKFYFWNVSDNERIFVIQFFSFGWRITCVSILVLFVFQYSKSLPLTIVFANSLLFALSGWLLRTVGKVIEVLNLPVSDEFKARTISAFKDFPFENLQWYDFGLFAALAIVPVLVVNFSNSHKTFLKILVVSILLTSLFEYIGFVLALAWILYRTRSQNSKLFSQQNLRTVTTVMFGTVIWLILISIYHRTMQSLFPKFFNSSTDGETPVSHIKGIFWAVQHPIENLTGNPSIPFQIILVIVQAALMGVFLGFISRQFCKNVQFEEQTFYALKYTTIATAVVMFINFFLAYGIEIQATEHARQTLGLQITLFTCLFLRTAIGKKTDRPVDAST